MRDFPGFSQLYNVNDPLGDRAYRGSFQHDYGFEYARGEARPRTAVTVRWAMGGGKPGDVIWTTSVHALVLSERVVRLLRTAETTGWLTYPVRVFDKAGSECPGYSGFAVLGRCGRVQLSRSNIILRRLPAGYYPYFEGHFFDPATWDGSDWVVDERDRQGRASSRRIVTARVVSLFKRNRIANIQFVPLPHVVTDTSVYEIGRKYLLPRDFKRRVAAAYRRADHPAPEKYR